MLYCEEQTQLVVTLHGVPRFDFKHYDDSDDDDDDSDSDDDNYEGNGAAKVQSCATTFEKSLAKNE